MHALEIINYRNAKEAGISVEQNLQEALAGQYIRQPSRDLHESESEDDAIVPSADFCLNLQQQESIQ